jgi:hypothetical protein
MKRLERLRNSFRAQPLTRRRMIFALAVAIAADGIQLLLSVLGPLGFFFDEIIDVVAMVLTMRTLGFHLLLLPTFVVELLPLMDMLPTWTACVIAVIALRKRGQPPAASAPGTPPPLPPPRDNPP